MTEQEALYYTLIAAARRWERYAQHARGRREPKAARFYMDRAREFEQQALDVLNARPAPRLRKDGLGEEPDDN